MILDYHLWLNFQSIIMSLRSQALGIEEQNKLFHSKSLNRNWLDWMEMKMKTDSQWRILWIRWICRRCINYRIVSFTLQTHWALSIRKKFCVLFFPFLMYSFRTLKPKRQVLNPSIQCMQYSVKATLIPMISAS